jgi:hypothetical protein
MGEAVAEQQPEHGHARFEDSEDKATRSRVTTSTPVTPMPMAAAKLDRPSESATSSTASMGSAPHCRSPDDGAIIVPWR